MADPVTPFTPEMQGQFNDLMALQTSRAQRQEPIHQAAMAMASRMAPGYARGAMTGPTALHGSDGGGASSGAPAGGSTGGGSDAAKKMALAATFAAIMRSMGGSGGDIGGLIALFKKLFGHGGGPGIQNDQPFGGGVGNWPGQTMPDQAFRGWDPRVSNANGVPYLTSDPGSYYDRFGGGAMPSDPSGGTGVGPGMQRYYDSLGRPTEEKP